MSKLFYLATENTKEMRIIPVTTGISGLDELFSVYDPDSDSVVSFKGIPSFNIVNLTGVNDTGKTLMIQQFLLHRLSQGSTCILITTEQPAPVMLWSMKVMGKALSIDFDSLKHKLYVIDAVENDELRDKPELLGKVLYELFTHAKENNIKRPTIIAIDSITGFYEHLESKARSVARRIYNTLKKFKLTGFVVSQKRSSHEDFSSESAGGYAVAHIFDGNIVLHKLVIDKPYYEKQYQRPMGSIIRLLRIDGMRHVFHSTQIHELIISEKGLVSIKPFKYNSELNNGR